MEGEHFQVWKGWKEDLRLISGLMIPRVLKPEAFGAIMDCRLHHFSYASEKGYRVVSYVRLQNEKAQVHRTFLGR